MPKPIAAAALLAFVPFFAQEPGGPPREQEVPLGVDVDRFPAPLRPYLGAAEGLEGLEMSLTMQVALAVGMLAEVDKLPKDFRELAKGSSENWDAVLREMLAPVKGAAPGTVRGGGLWFDTGIAIDREKRTAEVLRAPEFLAAPADDVEEILRRRQLVHGLRSGLEPEEAKALMELLEPLREESGPLDNPWLMHANTQALFMSMGAYEAYAKDKRENGTPFGTWEEFQTRVIDETAKALIAPLRLPLDDEVAKDRNFRYEGEFVVQVATPTANDEEGAADWPAPPTALAANAADGSPVLLVQVTPKMDRSMLVQFGRITIGMVVAGEHRVIYDGPFPIR